METQKPSIFDFLDEIEDENWSIEDTRDKYSIDNSVDAEKALAHYKRIMGQCTALQKQADQYLLEVKAKHEAYITNVIQPMLQKAEFFQERLKAFAERELKKSGKKSMKLVEGTLQFTKQRDKYIHDDEEILKYIASAQSDELKEYLKVPPAKLDWTKMREAGEFRTNKYGEEAFYVNDIKIPMVSIQRNLPPTFTIK